jgi:hypothetical protein
LDRLDVGSAAQGAQPRLEVPCGAPLGIAAGRPPTDIDERNVSSSALTCEYPGWDSNPHALSGNRF